VDVEPMALRDLEQAQEVDRIVLERPVRHEREPPAVDLEALDRLVPGQQPPP
jgi:hypothetical protein